MPTNAQIRRYLANQRKIPQVVNSASQKHEIRYGSRAVSKRLRKKLRPTTYQTDYDIYTNSPKKDAQELVRKLNKLMRFRAYQIAKAKYPHTTKVKSRLSSRTIADYTKAQGKVPYDTIGNINYAKTSYLRKQISNNLKNPEAEFRRQKDRYAQMQLNLAKARKVRMANLRKRKRSTTKRRTRRKNFYVPKSNLKW